MSQPFSRDGNWKRSPSPESTKALEVSDDTCAVAVKVDENTEANYHAMRDFNHKVAMQNWERGKEIHDYEFDSAMKQYERVKRLVMLN